MSSTNINDTTSVNKNLQEKLFKKISKLKEENDRQTYQLQQLKEETTNQTQELNRKNEEIRQLKEEINEQKIQILQLKNDLSHQQLKNENEIFKLKKEKEMELELLKKEYETRIFKLEKEKEIELLKKEQEHQIELLKRTSINVTCPTDGCSVGKGSIEDVNINDFFYSIYKYPNNGVGIGYNGIIQIKDRSIYTNYIPFGKLNYVSSDYPMKNLTNGYFLFIVRNDSTNNCIIVNSLIIPYGLLPHGIIIPKNSYYVYTQYGFSKDDLFHNMVSFFYGKEHKFIGSCIPYTGDVNQHVYSLLEYRIPNTKLVT